MKGLLSIALPVAALLIGCEQDVKLERRTVTYPNGKSVKEDWTFYRKPNGDSIAQGVHKKFFWNGTTSESVVWKEGRRDGSAQAWYENGGVKWQKSYEAGKKKGTWRLFYKDGHPWMVLPYKDDKLEGTVQVWDKADVSQPKEAKFQNGACQSGDCALMEAPAIPPDLPAPEKLEKTRDWDIVRDFLDN
jgi:antitoxin component YwqK of YwqJK toxin-antitoxin module